MHSPGTLPLTQATTERKRLSGPMSFKILLIIAIVAFLAYCEGYSKIDDSFIYARYISNALAGNGMVYNTGEHVNALSSPLYSYLLLLTSWLLHGNVLLGTIVLSGVFLVLASILAEYLTPFSGLFIASTAYFYYLVGMETSLFVFMILAIITLFQMEKWDWLPLASVLLVLSRFEGGLLVAVVAWRLYQRRVWPTWKAFIPAILLAVCYLLLNHHYYGVYLPSSATAKLGQGFSGLWGRWPTAFVSHFSMAMVTFQKTKFIMYLVAVFCITGVTQMYREGFSRLALPFCGLLLAFYVLLNMTGLYFWYFAPFIFFAIIYACGPIPKTRVATLTASVLLLGSVFANAGFLRLPWPEEDRYTGYPDAGKWIDQHTPPNAHVAAVEIGILGWYSNRYIVDVIGLVTPKNAVHVAHRDLISWLAEDRPDYIVAHQPCWSWEKAVAESPDYERLPLTFRGDVVILKRKN